MSSAGPPLLLRDRLPALRHESAPRLDGPAVMLREERTPRCGWRVSGSRVRVLQGGELLFPQDLKGDKVPIDPGIKSWVLKIGKQINSRYLVLFGNAKLAKHLRQHPHNCESPFISLYYYRYLRHPQRWLSLATRLPCEILAQLHRMAGTPFN